MWTIPTLIQATQTSVELNTLFNCSKIQKLPQKTISYMIGNGGSLTKGGRVGAGGAFLKPDA